MQFFRHSNTLYLHPSFTFLNSFSCFNIFSLSDFYINLNFSSFVDSGDGNQLSVLG